MQEVVLTASLAGSPVSTLSGISSVHLQKVFRTLCDDDEIHDSCELFVSQVAQDLLITQLLY
jgi:hypothetical protein